MTYSAAPILHGEQMSISTTSEECLGLECTELVAISFAQNNWISANLAVFIPFQIREPVKVTKLWWPNGAAAAGNIDVAVYDTNGNVLVSAGTTLQAGTSTIQTVDVTDTGLDRGRYYFGMVSDTSGVTQKVYANLSVAGIWQSIGLLQQAGVTLPLATNANPATFAKYTQAFCPRVGLLANRVLAL